MSSLPPGVTDAMCEANCIDENQPCGTCDHELNWHDDDKFCHCCKKKHESCDYVFLCEEHKLDEPNEKAFTWYCSKNFELGSPTSDDGKPLGINPILLLNHTGKLFGKAYEKVDANENPTNRMWRYTYKKIDKKQNYRMIVLGHSEAMEKWRNDVKMCCETTWNAEDGCKECNCKAYNDEPPEPDEDRYEEDWR